jgi:nicotinamide mononucleotide transporter
MNALLQHIQPLFAVAFSAGGVAVTWLEAAAFAISIAMVALEIRVDPLAWPLAIVTSLMYLLLFWRSRLYGNAALQVLFIAVAVWGWWQWVCGTAADGSPLGVTWLGTRGRWATACAVALAWPATALWLRHSTDSAVPWWDAFPTAASVVNQWLVGRKHVESWAVWIVVNVVAAALFAYQGLWLTALLYAVFIAMAVAGWRAWARLAAQAGPPRSPAFGGGDAAVDAPAPASR